MRSADVVAAVGAAAVIVAVVFVPGSAEARIAVSVVVGVAFVVWLVLFRQSRESRTPFPTTSPRVRARHAHVWPGEYDGVVWVWIRPTRDRVDQLHRIELSWGPWHRADRVRMGKEGLALLTGKSADANPVTCHMDVDPPASVVFGTDEPPDGVPTKDIRRGWRNVEAAATKPARWWARHRN